MRNALTVDVEEYFQVEAFRGLIAAKDWPQLESRVLPRTRQLLDLFEVHGVSATFFVVGWVAQRYPQLVREIHGRGHELGCHSYAHQPIYSMDRRGFRKDLRQAKHAIEDAASAPIAGYRAPTCSVVRATLWALEILAEEGFRYDSSIFPIHHDRYGIPDAPRFPHRVPLSNAGEIVEFPMSTIRVAGQNLPFCGGGYFRLVPYSIIGAAIRHVNAQERMPVMVYVHPWEIDPDQPRVSGRWPTRFRHYVNLRHTLPKLDRLLRAFSFTTMSRVLEERGFPAVVV